MDSANCALARLKPSPRKRRSWTAPFPRTWLQSGESTPAPPAHRQAFFTLLSHVSWFFGPPCPPPPQMRFFVGEFMLEKLANSHDYTSLSTILRWQWSRSRAEFAGILSAFEPQSRYNLETCQKRFHPETTNLPLTIMLMIFDKHIRRFIRNSHWKPATWRTIDDGFAICQPLQAAAKKNKGMSTALDRENKLPIYPQVQRPNFAHW